MPGSVKEALLPGLAGWLGCYYAWFLLTPAVFWVEKRFPLSWPPSLRRTTLLCILGLPFSYAASYLGTAISFFLRLLVVRHTSSDANFGSSRPGDLNELGLAFALYIVTIAGSALIRHRKSIRQQEREASRLRLEKVELERALKQAELETLRMRLNPHFLFNCLQNISALVGQDSKAARQMLANLGDLLRIALRSDYTAEVSLEEELKLADAYISIERVRFGDRLTVMFETGEETLHTRVPSLLLQPLIENAIKYGVDPVSNRAAIWVQSRIERDRLVLAIRDSGRGCPAPFTSMQGNADGIGLGVTRERLMRLYGPSQELTLHSLPEGGTEIRILLPLRSPTESAAHEISSRGTALNFALSGSPFSALHKGTHGTTSAADCR
jgi:two-component system, LytTR family, sensor kinase